MKFCIIQPFYSFDYSTLDKCYEEMVSLLNKCDESMDVIVLPEYSDVPANTPNKAEYDKSVKKYNADILSKCVACAIKNKATVFVNCADKTADGYRNTTHVIDKTGKTVGKYYKAHPAPSEVKTSQEGGNGLDVEYSYHFEPPYTVEVDGVKYGFMTCYDFYFYESFARVALEDVDVIIGTSHQRTDLHSTLETIGKFLSYNTNSYLVRSAVSLGTDSKVCGCSMIVSPKGEMLVDIKNEVGLACAEFDPHDKYYKPAGFMGKDKSHYEYIEEGRRPWLYRNGGPGTAVFDKYMPYPRVCAHRGFNTVAPENSLPAFGAAVALGAEEIEFDLWKTTDGEIVSCHDATLERVSTGEGKIYEKDYQYLKTLDFGVKYSEKFRGLKIPTFEDILKALGGRCVMNIHIKDTVVPDWYIHKLMALLKKYDCVKHGYFMISENETIKRVKELYPEMRVCVGHSYDDPWGLVDRAIALKAEKVQFFMEFINEDMVKKAKENGIISNAFFADTEEKTKYYLDMGIDTILTNDYLNISNFVKGYIDQNKRNV